jgi:hypothetical protein
VVQEIGDRAGKAARNALHTIFSTINKLNMDQQQVEALNNDVAETLRRHGVKSFTGVWFAADPSDDCGFFTGHDPTNDGEMAAVTLLSNKLRSWMKSLPIGDKEMDEPVNEIAITQCKNKNVSCHIKGRYLELIKILRALMASDRRFSALLSSAFFYYNAEMGVTPDLLKLNYQTVIKIMNDGE